MGGSVLTDLPNEEKPHPPLRHSEIFEAQFPHYLAIGMSADEYWNGDCQLVKAYREAEKLRFDRMNFEMWLQGRYVYDAICCAYPLLNAMSKKTEAYPYNDEPYKFPKSEKERIEIQREAEKKEYMAERAKIEAMLVNANQSFMKRGEDSGG